VTGCDLKKSFVFEEKQLKLQALCAFRFMCKDIVDNARYIPRGLGVRKVSNSKSDI